MKHSLNAVKNLVKENGAIVCDNLSEVANFLNNNAHEEN